MVDNFLFFLESAHLGDLARQAEFLPLAGFTHMVPDPVVNENLHGRIAGYMQKHLGRPE